MPAYPHRRDDCDCCQQFDADMRACYDEEHATRSVRWCQRCAGGLLAQLVAAGRTISVRSLEGNAVAASGPHWTVELAEQVLRQALPTGSRFLRALIDEGGSASAARMRELTGESRLHPMTLTLNHAARHVTGRRKFR
ncbi:MAG: hypothetical protein GEU98_29485, partial [Pseudonocardiaceae bacterium]|nr:hypothetical protein [Pseudonocardiaceae bacterium]